MTVLRRTGPLWLNLGLFQTTRFTPDFLITLWAERQIEGMLKSIISQWRSGFFFLAAMQESRERSDPVIIQHSAIQPVEYVRADKAHNLFILMSLICCGADLQPSVCFCLLGLPLNALYITSWKRSLCFSRKPKLILQDCANRGPHKLLSGDL